MVARNKIIVGLGILLIIAFSAIIGATITELTPEDETWTNNATVDFLFTLDNHENQTCNLVVDSVKVQSRNASYNNTFTENLIEGNHVWSINCVLNNNTQSSEERNIHIDLTKPEITLGLPTHNTTHTNVTSISFTAEDNMLTEFNCSLKLNGVEQLFVVQSGLENLVSIDSVVGKNYWNVSCQDTANNGAVSETRSFTIKAPPKPEPEFNVTLERKSYNPGEQALMKINAKNGSNVTVEICPNQQGFVLCYSLLSFSSATYPTIKVMPYTNKSGEYILEGMMKHGNITKTYSETFTINNNLNIEVIGDTSFPEDEKEEIEIRVTGGIAPYTYKWTLSGGGTSTKKDQNFTYENPGEYNNIIKVTDAKGNTKNETVTITVKILYKLKIIAKNSNNNLLSNVALEIGNKEATTNSNGEATFYLTKGTYTIYADHSSYKFYTEEGFKLKENSTKTIGLLTDDNDAPIVTILSPKSGDKLAGNELSLLFKVSDDADKVICDLYSSEGNDNWYTLQKTVDVTSTADQRIVLPIFGNGIYKLKLECKDLNNNIAVTPEITVEFVDKESLSTFNPNDNLAEQLYALLDGLPQKTLQQRQVLEALGFEEIITQAIKTVERATRDIYNVEYRNDLSTEEKVAKQRELAENIDKVYQSTPIDIKVLESKSFVKYIKEDELKLIVEEIIELKGIREKESYLEAAIMAQKAAIITTGVKTVELFYMNGSKQDITLVVKEFNYVNATKEFQVIEHISKEIVSSTDQLVILTDHIIIKEDPIIQFESPEKIVYYVKGLKDLSLFEKANTIVLPEAYGAETSNRITGRSIFETNVEFDAKTSLILLIVILIVIYGGYSLNAFEKVKVFYYVFAGDKRLHNMNMLINDANDNIEVKNFDKSYLIYREMKLYYDKLSMPAKNEVYDSVIAVCNKLDYEYAQQLFAHILENLSDGNKLKSKELYNKLRTVYKKLDEGDKKKIYSDIIKVSGKIAQ